MYILLVEEDHFYASMIMGFLKKAGFSNIKHIDNGVDCLLQVYEESTPDLVILDSHLSRVNGVDVIQKLVTHKPGMKILVMKPLTSSKKFVEPSHRAVIDIILKDELVLDHLMPHIHIIHSEVVQRKKSRPVTNMLVNFKRFIFAP
ncbi:MAG: response regulator [Bacteroidales bacterium]|nr:response regulator [Bacteroidales bacterium]